jgi:hypothetical protein
MWLFPDIINRGGLAIDYNGYVAMYRDKKLPHVDAAVVVQTATEPFVISVYANKTQVGEFVEPSYEFPSDKLLAQVMLVAG